jgi:hypothetical protein
MEGSSLEIDETNVSRPINATEDEVVLYCREVCQKNAQYCGVCNTAALSFCISP